MLPPERKGGERSFGASSSNFRGGQRSGHAPFSIPPFELELVIDPNLF